MSAQALQSVEVSPTGEVRSTVVWLHGLGADGHDFEPLVPVLELPQELGVRFVFPHAPERPVTVNAGFVMRAWYDIVDVDLESRVDRQGLAQSREAITALVDQEIARGVPPHRVVVAGFSQGGAVALDVGLRYPQPLAGIMGLSSYIPAPDTLSKHAHPANAGTPIFLAHGTYDPVVPFAAGRAARTYLQELGHRPEWHDYPMDHSVAYDEIQDIRNWLLRVLRLDGPGAERPHD